VELRLFGCVSGCPRIRIGGGRGRRRCQRVVLALALAVGVVIAVPSSASAATFSSGPSGISGGGYENVIAVAPPTAQTSCVGDLVAGGDTSGVHTSTNHGATWAPSNATTSTYTPGTLNLKFASLAWSQLSGSGTVYGLTGNGAAGGLVESTDCGTTWSQISSLIYGQAGDLTNDSNPRAVGHLIALDEANNYLYVGAVNGIWRVNLTSFATTHLTVLSGDQISDLVINPNTSGTGATLWATVPIGTARGIYKLTNVTGSSGTKTTVTGGPDQPWQLVALDLGSTAAIWVVGNSSGSGAQGVFRCGSGGTTCTNETGSLDIANTVWTSVDGFYDSGASTERVYIGAFTGPSGTFNAPIVEIDKPSSGALTYTNLPTSASGAGTTIGTATGPEWWLTNPSPPTPDPPNTSHPENLLGGSAYRVSQVVIDPNTTGTLSSLRILSAGKSGVWRSNSDGAQWYPIVNGLSSTVDRFTLDQPGTPANIADGDIDWSVPWSKSNLSGQPVLNEPPKTYSTYALAFDSSGTVYTGEGLRDDPTQDGYIYSDANLFGGSSTWVNVGTPGGQANGVIGLATGSPSSGTTRLFAAVYGDTVGTGLYYKDLGTGSWTSSTLSPSSVTIGATNSQKRVSIVSQPGCVGSSCWVFVYDPGSGLWRSTNTGVSFTRLFTYTTTSFTSGFLAADPRTTANTLYLTEGARAEKLTNLTATPVTETPLTVASGSCSTITDPGPVDVDAAGRAYLTQDAMTCPALYRAATAGATALTEIDDAAYRAQALYPLGLDAAADNTYVYVPTDGSGVLVGTYQ
jgi:hypothetical protein